MENYIPFIAERSGKNEDEIRKALRLLPLHRYGEMHYQQMKSKAEELIGERDPKDVDILALALAEHAMLWSEDRDFEDITEITLIRTQDLI